MPSIIILKKAPIFWCTQIVLGNGSGVPIANHSIVTTNALREPNIRSKQGKDVSMKHWITSDTHHGHRNICGPEGFVSTRRHFASPEEMDEALIAAHNAVVAADDHTYHNGDIAINLKPAQVHAILCRKNGSMPFDAGNHDNSKLLKYLKANNFLLPY